MSTDRDASRALHSTIAAQMPLTLDLAVDVVRRHAKEGLLLRARTVCLECFRQLDAKDWHGLALAVRRLADAVDPECPVITQFAKEVLQGVRGQVNAHVPDPATCAKYIDDLARLPPIEALSELRGNLIAVLENAGTSKGRRTRPGFLSRILSRWRVTP